VRIDAVEELFDRRLFSHATFAAMNQPGRPIIVLNSTDMAGGETFEFTPERFDDICSSLDDTPVSVGVAASAAFPIALSPVNFQDYSEGCMGSPRRALWADIDTKIPEEAIANLEEYRSARYTNDLRHGKFVFRNIEYLHLLDGGLADNLGINSLRAALVGTHNDARVLKAINDGKIQRLVVITINARSDKPSKLYKSAPAPGVVDMFNSVTSVPIDANSAGSQEVLAGLLGELAKAAQEARSAQFHRMTIYGITVDFDQIPADTEEHRALRDRAKDVPTSWALTAPQLKTTEQVGKLLVIHNPCFQALVSDLRTGGPGLNDVTLSSVCPTRLAVSGAP
jgi:NTE family protein